MKRDIEIVDLNHFERKFNYELQRFVLKPLLCLYGRRALGIFDILFRIPASGNQWSSFLLTP